MLFLCVLIFVLIYLIFSVLFCAALERGIFLSFFFCSYVQIILYKMFSVYRLKCTFRCSCFKFFFIFYDCVFSCLSLIHFFCSCCFWQQKIILAFLKNIFQVPGLFQTRILQLQCDRFFNLIL